MANTKLRTKEEHLAARPGPEEEYVVKVPVTITLVTRVQARSIEHARYLVIGKGPLKWSGFADLPAAWAEMGRGGGVVDTEGMRISRAEDEEHDDFIAFLGEQR